MCVNGIPKAIHPSDIQIVSISPAIRGKTIQRGIVDPNGYSWGCLFLSGDICGHL